MYGLSKKTLIKANKELVELHKRCITTYLTQRNLRPRYQKKFMKIYDSEVDEDNILNYFHRPISLFVKAIILSRLWEIEDYMMGTKSKKKRRKKNV